MVGMRGRSSLHDAYTYISLTMVEVVDLQFGLYGETVICRLEQVTFGNIAGECIIVLNLGEYTSFGTYICHSLMHDPCNIMCIIKL